MSLSLVREILALRNKPTWVGNALWMLASTRAQEGLTTEQWGDMSLSSQYEKLAYYSALATAQEWASLTDKERSRLFNYWKLKQLEAQEQRRKEQKDA